MIQPNFIIAGAPKCGTSSLHTWLADHPDVMGSDPKETYFMVDPGTHMYRADNHISHGWDGYAANFAQQAPARVIMESTPSYMYSATALSALSALPTPPKMLFVLREPGAQIQSLFQYFQNNWDWIPGHMSFADFIAAVKARSHDFKGNELAQDCLTNAAYVDHLILWRDALGAENLRVALFDDLVEDGIGFTKDVATWLDLDPGFYDAYDFPRENETYTPRSRALQSLNVAVRDKLPKGALYRAARAVYRRLNTTRKKPDPDAETLALIRAELADANARLAQTFDLDLGRWG